MKNIIREISAAVLMLSMLTVAYSQNPSVIVIESQLTDIEGESVPVVNMDLTVLILDSNGEQCYEDNKTITTNDLGTFQYFIEETPQLFKAGIGSDPAEIQLTITSPDDDAWLEEGKFIVKYLMTLEGDKENPEYFLTRMEGQKLNYEYRSDIWKFNDIYPFAYISSTFLISFNEEIADAKSLLMVAQEFFSESENKNAEEMEAPPASSRGIKGGPAVGGFKKK